MKLQPDGVVAELAARQPRPFDGVLAFLDILLRFAPLIVEQCHPLGRSRQVGDDKSNAGIQFARLAFDFGHDTTFFAPTSGLIAETGIVSERPVRGDQRIT